MENSTVIVVGVILVLLMLALGPIITIWSLNTLFGLSIPTNIATWFAALWTSILVGSAAARSSSK